MTETIQDDLRVEGKLEVIGEQDTTQVTVQGNTQQTYPLHQWQDATANPLARISEDGRLQIGSFESGALATDDAHIEVYRDEMDTAKPKRGTHVMGAIKDALSNIVSWSVHELVLKGTQGVQALHTGLRVRLINENTGTDNDGAELRAGDIETINHGGGSGAGERVQTMIGLRVAVTNPTGGYVTDAYGLKISIVDETSGGIANPCAIQIDNAFELLAPANVPGAPAAGAVRVYARDGHLYTKLSSDNEYQLSIAPTPVSGDETKFLRGDGTWQEVDSGSGTVTSVGLSAPSDLFTVSNSPVTSDGTITLSKSAQNINLV